MNDTKQLTLLGLGWLADKFNIWYWEKKIKGRQNKKQPIGAWVEPLFAERQWPAAGQVWDQGQKGAKWANAYEIVVVANSSRSSNNSSPGPSGCLPSAEYVV